MSAVKGRYSNLKVECQCKISTVAEEYNIENVHHELASRWTREEDRYGLRALAEFLNQRILQNEMKSSGMNPLDGEVENVYRLLTDSDVSSGSSVQARNRLRKNGIDADQLQSDFVSYQTINRHLKDCLELEYKQAAETKSKNALERIQALRNRTQKVTRQTVDQLKRNNEVRIKSPDVFVSMQIVCEECGSQFDIDELMNGNACACPEDEN